MNDLKYNSRLCLQSSIKNFYNRLNIEMTHFQKSKLANLQKLKINLSEHALMFPWLGIYRIPLMLSENLGKDTIGIFIINNHVHRREQLWTRDLNIYFRGLNSNNQKNPIVMKCDRKQPLNLAPIPSEKEILVISEKIKGKISQNILWQQSTNNLKISDKKKTHLFHNLDFLINMLIEYRSITNNYSDWLSLFNINLMRLTNPNLYDKVLFVSFTDLMENSSSLKNLIFEKSEQIVQSVNKTIDYQKDKKTLVYKDEHLRPNYLPFWFYCPKCNSRKRGNLISNKTYSFECGKHFNYQGNINSKTDFLTAFDVISIEVFTSFLDISERVVGSIKNYSLAVDNVTKDVFGIDPPVRVPLTTQPVFRGIGTEKEGCKDATIFSALIELSPEILGKSLVTKWQDTPIINATY